MSATFHIPCILMRDILRVAFTIGQRRKDLRCMLAFDPEKGMQIQQLDENKFRLMDCCVPKSAFSCFVLKEYIHLFIQVEEFLNILNAGEDCATLQMKCRWQPNKNSADVELEVVSDDGYFFCQFVSSGDPSECPILGVNGSADEPDAQFVLDYYTLCRSFSIFKNMDESVFITVTSVSVVLSSDVDEPTARQQFYSHTFVPNCRVKSIMCKKYIEQEFATALLSTLQEDFPNFENFFYPHFSKEVTVKMVEKKPLCVTMEIIQGGSLSLYYSPLARPTSPPTKKAKIDS